MAERQILFVRGGKLGDEKDKSDDGESTTAEDDAWDDTALVQAYEHAVSLAKKEVERQMMRQNKESPSGNESNTSNKTRRRRKKSNNKKDVSRWQVGDACRAVYSSDGVIYEATINSISQEKGTCVVIYIGYNNQEEVSLQMLQPSQGQAARKSQEELAKKEQMLNGIAMECSDEEPNKEFQSKNFIPLERKSPRGSKMDWEPRTVGTQGSNSFPSNYRPLRMPPMGIPPMAVAPPPPPYMTTGFPEEDSEALSAMLMSWYMSGFHTGYYQGLRQAKNFSTSGGSRTSSRKK